MRKRILSVQLTLSFFGRIGASVSVVAGALTVAGCSAPETNVATLDEDAQAVVALSNQVTGAQDMVQCLRDMAVPAELDWWDDGQAQMVFEDGVRWRLCQRQDGHCHGGGGPNDTQANADAAERELDLMAQKYWDGVDQLPPNVRGIDILLAGGTDYTEQYVQCANTIDYEPPTHPQIPEQELAWKTAVATASNNWVACARDNGHPYLSDVDPPVADNFKTQPVALLPITISPAQVKLLIEACPLKDFTEDNIEPAVSVDAPGYDGREPLRKAALLDEKTQLIVDDLIAIIFEPTM